ncbi:MAG: hypothetical protein ABI354_01210 [Candidatus Saccharimonadales bacterium]
MTKNNELYDPRQAEVQMPRVSNYPQENGHVIYRNQDTNHFMSEEQVGDAFAAAREIQDEANAKLEVFDRSADLAANPAFTDMGIPELKVAGVSRTWLREHGYDGVKLDDFKADVLEYKELKAAEEAQAAKQAERAERNSKLEEAYQDRQSEAKEFRESRQAGVKAVESKSYQAMLKNGGRIAMQRNPKLADDIKAVAIDQAKSEGHDVSTLEKPVKTIVTNPQAEKRTSEMGRLLKDFHREVLSIDETHGQRLPKKPTSAGTELRDKLEAGVQAQAQEDRRELVQRLVDIKRVMAKRYAEHDHSKETYDYTLDEIDDKRVITILKKVYGTSDDYDPRVVKASKELDEYELSLVEKSEKQPNVWLTSVDDPSGSEIIPEGQFDEESTNPWLPTRTGSKPSEAETEIKGWEIPASESKQPYTRPISGEIPTQPKKGLRARMQGAISRAKQLFYKKSSDGELVVDDQGKNVVSRRKVVATLGVAAVGVAGVFVAFGLSGSHDSTNSRVNTEITVPAPNRPTTTSRVTTTTRSTVGNKSSSAVSTSTPNSISDNTPSATPPSTLAGSGEPVPVSATGSVLNTPESLSSGDTIWDHVEKRLSAQGSQPTQAQIMAETQKILDLNNLTLEQANSLPTGFTFTVK